MAFATDLTNRQWALVSDLFDPPARRGAPARIPRRGPVSWVANVLVSIEPSDHEVINSLNEWLRESCPWNEPSVPPGATGVGFLLRLTDRNTTWGGWKHPECHVWGGALNHAGLDALLDHVRTLPWAHPGCVQVLIMDQEESYFRLWMFRDGELRQYAPPPDPSDDLCA